MINAHVATRQLLTEFHRPVPARVPGQPMTTGPCEARAVTCRNQTAAHRVPQARPSASSRTANDQRLCNARAVPARPITTGVLTRTRASII
jgi:hypothetical protein